MKSKSSIVTFSIVGILAVGIYFTVLLSSKQTQTKQEAAGASASTGKFTIIGSKIYDPNGNPFIVKGTDIVHETFIGDNGNAQLNYQNAQRDLAYVKGLGVNLARIFVSADIALNPKNPQYNPNFFPMLDTIVTDATQQGLVVELAQADTNSTSEITQFAQQAANRYKNNPYVWLEPFNEPNCDYGDTTKCTDWSYWQTQEKQLIQTIRTAGMTSPIVINGINWSGDLSQIGNYPLGDSTLIYGAHRYANANQTFTAAEQTSVNSKWANLAKKFPIIVDEVGSFNNANNPPYLVWNQGFMNFVRDWIATRGGGGMSAYTWFKAGAIANNGVYYSDSMSGDPQNHISNDVLNAWGNIYTNFYLKNIPFTSLSYTVYDSTLKNGWADWSSQTSNTDNFSDTSHPYISDTYDLSWTAKVRGAYINLHTSQPVNTTGYTYLTFVMQATQPNQSVAVNVLDQSGNITSASLPLANYGGDPIAANYTMYKIPLSDLQATNKSIAGIHIKNNTTVSQSALYIDRIGFSR